MKGTISVETRQGTLIGTCEHGVSVFKAVPYAQPPVGKLRFKPPMPASMQEELDCTQNGPIAPQLPSRLEDVMGPLNVDQSEDCLHLTVWTPAADAGKRPVVVWLHGGAWQSGGGAVDWYSGAQLAAFGDVVVVCPNYRLAALGWLYVPGETANLGLLDQEAAIQWVADNIQNFGGDPNEITVMGQSAGGSCIAAMLARQPIFKRAIMQSASLGRGFRPAAQAAALSELVLQAAGASDIDHARNLPYKALLLAQRAAPVVDALKSDEIGRALFCPVVDGEIIAADMESTQQAAAGRADVLIGYTLNEMAAFPNVEISDASQQAGEAIFGAPSLQWAKAAKSQGKSAWVYRFDYAPTRRFGACHCIELPFVFGTFPAFGTAPMLDGMPIQDAMRISEKMQRNWIAFIRGSPVEWAPYPYQELIE